MDATLYLVIGFALSFILGTALGAGLTFFINRKNAGKLDTAMENQFKVSAQEAIKQAQESFLALAEERFKSAQKDGAHDLDKRQKAIEELVKPVHEKLQNLSGAVDQSKGLYQALQNDLQNLNKETAKLAGALRNPVARGNWGEAILERLLEHSGLIKGVHYHLQTSLPGGDSRLIPDATIELPDSLHIVIDSKAPINDFVRNLDEDMDEAYYKQLQTGLAQAVKSRIQDLSKKAYWENLNSPDFVVLFLPSEHLFSAAIQADPSLLDLAAEKKIVMASPVLMMSLLRVVRMSWRQIEMAQNAQTISEQGQELYKRFITFTEHFEKIGKSLQSAMNSYDSAIGSMERKVLPAGRKLHELQSSNAALKEPPSFDPIEKQPRKLVLHEDDEKEKKRA